MAKVRETEPKIEIDDLQPDWSIKGFKARWQEDGVSAVVELLPLQDQPARGYVLDVYTANESARPLGKRQQERANALIAPLKARMLEAMKQAGWSVVGKLESPPMDIWQHSSRIPTAQPLQVEQNQIGAGIPKKQKTLLVAAREGEKRNIKGYSRTITATDVTFTCSRCRCEVTRSQYPGRAAQYCETCAAEVKREKGNARRMKSYYADKASKDVNV